jgi:hypothetical protein
MLVLERTTASVYYYARLRLSIARRIDKYGIRIVIRITLYSRRRGYRQAGQSVYDISFIALT